LSQTTGCDCLIGVFDIGIEAAEIAVAFRAILHSAMTARAFTSSRK